jgi:hypothetical protein
LRHCCSCSLRGHHLLSVQIASFPTVLD